MTRAPAADARSPVASVDPSSMTRTSCHDAALLNAETSGPIDAASLKAGITIDVCDVSIG